MNNETHDRIAQLEKDVDMLRLQLESVTDNLTMVASWIEEHNRVHWPELCVTPEFKKWLQDADR